MRALVCSSNAVYLGGEFDLAEHQRSGLLSHWQVEWTAWRRWGGASISARATMAAFARWPAPNGDVCGGVFNNSGGTQLLSIALGWNQLEFGGWRSERPGGCEFLHH